MRSFLFVGYVLISSALAQAQQQAPAPVTPDQNLSEKLNRSDGVITPPPSGDAQMTQTPPNVGAKMPVIPPEIIPPANEPPGTPKPEAK